ncbi:NACHT domain-containing protein [Humibacillus xanthopallidus]|uniref:NACHT domain-containing protein n=1 Tax=Humibacillus xanthopallidus TaxID=412689 RepID=A0A543HZI8_9MICO|nr:NTPase [Humibacillus xanthopallidus]TQM63728.1 hypothetical protein FBY41_0073 [Humibacillus xanthopallidus]
MDHPKDFEVRVLAIARAIHDPLGLQGSRMILGKERDGVFISEDAINVYEVTTSPAKAKAVKDGQKLAELVKHLKSARENRFKSATGWFVTAGEPTAEQREAIRSISRTSTYDIHIVSVQTLRGRLCNVEGYLAARGQSPFGSVYSDHAGSATVEPRIRRATKQIGVRELAAEILDGARLLLTGDFGVGKSFTLRELYFELRKRYFKRPAENPFPVHINLRECVGLRTPAEVLRRHAEEIGFSDDRGLISAWRAGSCILLLDGFDEVIPSRWLGSATNLRQVRWEALSPIRRLVEEAPHGAGIIVAGRGHYFSSPEEMQSALGLGRAETLFLDDFDEEQADEFLAANTPGLKVPEWLPTRPLLLSHLVKIGALSSAAEIGQMEPAAAWRVLLQMICEREARIYQSVPPQTIQALLQRLATAARMKGDPLSRLTVADLERVFFEVSGRRTDEEVFQLLLRLPGLAVTESGANAEERIFADEVLASTAYGEDLAEYISSPYQGHVLCEAATWPDSADDMAIDACALSLGSRGITPRQVIAACENRMNHHFYDAILMDAIRVSDEVGDHGFPGNFIVEGILVRQLAVGPEMTALGNAHIRDSVIEVLDMSQVERADDCPTIEKSLVSKVLGLTSLSDALKVRFPATEIAQFSASNATTNGIMGLTLDLDDRVALSVLHKVYAKRGSGRKDSALPRGLDQAAKERLPHVLTELLSSGLLSSTSRGNVVLYLPVKGISTQVAELLAAPNTFRLSEAATLVGATSD